MKTVTISAVCDRCSGAVEEGSPGNGILVALGSKKPVEVDLCATCLIDAHEALDAAIANGVVPRTTRGTGSSAGRGRGNWNKREQIECPLCSKAVATGAGQVLHARKIHGMEKEQVWAPSAAA